MAYDEALAERVRRQLTSRGEIVEKKMFGGLCFMLSGHMCCGISEQSLIARVGPDQYEQSLARSHARLMDFTGRPMKGMVTVEPEGIESESDLISWIEPCVQFVHSLPPTQ